MIALMGRHSVSGFVRSTAWVVTAESEQGLPSVTCLDIFRQNT